MIFHLERALKISILLRSHDSLGVVMNGINCKSRFSSKKVIDSPICLTDLLSDSIMNWFILYSSYFLIHLFNHSMNGGMHLLGPSGLDSSFMLVPRANVTLFSTIVWFITVQNFNSGGEDRNHGEMQGHKAMSPFYFTNKFNEPSPVRLEICYSRKLHSLIM